MKAIIRDPKGMLILRLKVFGCRFSENTCFTDSSQNRLILKRMLHQIKHKIEYGTFNYMLHFPHSLNAALIASLQSRFLSPCWRGLPTFEHFYSFQFDSSQHALPLSSRAIVMAHLGLLRVNEIAGHQIMTLIEVLNKNKNLTTLEINYAVVMVFEVLDCAARCFAFPRPFRFMLECSESTDDPLSHQDVLYIADHVPVKYREFFLLRYYLGISVRELLALQWRNYVMSESTFRLPNKDIIVEPYARKVLFHQMKKTGNFKYVFSDPHSNKLRLNLAWLHKSCWPKACIDAGYKARGLYALRQASVAYLFEAGLSVNQICHQTGLHFRPVVDLILTKHILNVNESIGHD